MMRSDYIRRGETIFNPYGNYRLIIKWAEVAYKLKRADIELLFSLYDRDWFVRQDFLDATLIQSWNSKRWHKYLEDGLIVRTNHAKRHRDNMRYSISHSSKVMLERIARIGLGLEEIPESTARNEIMKKKSYSHKLLAKAIQKFNRDK